MCYQVSVDRPGIFCLYQKFLAFPLWLAFNKMSCLHSSAEIICWVKFCRYVLPLVWVCVALYIACSIRYERLELSISPSNPPQHVALSDQKVDWLNGSSRAFEILVASLTPMTAAIISKRGILVDMLGATHVFATTRLLETEPSVYVHLAYTTATWASCDASTNVWSDIVSEVLSFSPRHLGICSCFRFFQLAEP